MKWITREHVKVDRVASPWLIRRFVDPAATFLFAPAERVAELAERQGAIPFDVTGAELGHRDGECSFDAIVRVYGLGRDPALLMLGRIVNGADIPGSPRALPESAGLKAVAEGFRRLGLRDDHEILAAEWIVYDALYAWCLDEVRTAGGSGGSPPGSGPTGA